MDRVIHRGFTLIELIVTLAIASVLMMAGVFETTRWIDRIRADATVDRFLGLIQIARTTAIHHNTPVTLCPGSAAMAPLVCGARNSWQNGAIVFIDRNRDRRLDPEDVIVAEQPPIERIRIYWRSFRNRSYLRFTGSGMTDWQNGHFLFCPQPPRERLVRQIILNYAGRTYRSRDRDNDGIHEGANGRAIHCP